MYSKNGSFGLVRLASPQTPADHLFSLSVCGWHRCNDLYRIHRGEHKSALLLYTVDGCGEMEIEGEYFSLPAGTVALIPKGAAGSYGTPKGKQWEFYWVHPNGALCQRLLSPFPKAVVQPAKDLSTAALQVENLIQLCHQHNPTALSRALSELLHTTIEMLSEQTTDGSLSARAKAYFAAHSKQKVTVEQVAGALFVSPAHLIRVFKKETGQTPHAYLTHLRLEDAKRLLATGLSVRLVADACGFCSASHLISAFKRAYGTTPAQF